MLGRSSLGRDFCGILAATLLSVLAIGFAVRTGQDEAVSAYSTGNCGDTEVFVMVKIHRRWSDRRGEAVGYSIGGRTIGAFISAIYDAAESRYQRWRGNGSADFDPLPPADLGLETRVFELPGRTYNRDSPSRESPPLMNIFFDPQQFSHDQFTALSDCFEKNEREFNRVLAQLGSGFKWSAAGTYFPLRLGGIVYGLPPYADRRYLAAIHAIWGLADPPPPVVTLPASGLLTILPGQRAEGRVGGASFDIGVDDGPRAGFLTYTSRVTINNIVIAPVSRHNDDSITYSLTGAN
jgi:hypothetical protein